MVDEPVHYLVDVDLLQRGARYDEPRVVAAVLQIKLAYEVVLRDVRLQVNFVCKDKHWRRCKLTVWRIDSRRKEDGEGVRIN